MFEFVLFNSYINFVGFVLMLVSTKVFIKDNFNALATFGMPILYVGIVPSLLAWGYFGVPIVSYLWSHYIVTLFHFCYNFWFV